MNVRFFDELPESGRPRNEVRILDMGLFVFEDKRRVAVGLEITPFLEPPSIEITVTKPDGREVGSMTVVNTAETNFTLVLHLKEEEPSGEYSVRAVLYYATPGVERTDVDEMTRTFDVSHPGVRQ